MCLVTKKKDPNGFGDHLKINLGPQVVLSSQLFIENLLQAFSVPTGLISWHIVTCQFFQQCPELHDVLFGRKTEYHMSLTFFYITF